MPVIQANWLWVISRAGQYYRCLALAESWLCGRDVLEACLRLTKVFSDKSNRVALEVELRLAVDRFKDHESPDEAEYTLSSRHHCIQRCQRNRRSHIFRFGHPIDPLKPVRFPFISTCLISGTNTTVNGTDIRLRDVELEYYAAMFHDIDMHKQVHTFIDITDLDNVRHCFMTPWASQPWSGRQYLTKFEQIIDPSSLVDDHLEPFKSQKAWELADELQKIDLIPLLTVMDIWPWYCDEIDPECFSMADRSGQPPKPQTRGGAPLIDQALSVLVRTMISAPDSESEQRVLDGLVGIPTIKPALKRHLAAVKKHLPNTPATSALLRAAYAGETILDWADYYGLPANVIKTALNSPELQNAHTLILCPDWTTASASDLSQAICALPNLHDLYIMELPDRKTDDPIAELYTTLATHPRCPPGKIHLSAAFSSSLIYFPWLSTPVTSTPKSLPPQHPILQLLLTTTTTHHPSAFYLADAFLTPIRLINALIALLARRIRTPTLDAVVADALWSSVAALCSRAAPTFGDETAMEVTPLPAEVFAVASFECFRGSAVRDLRPGMWTVVVCESGRGDGGREEGMVVDGDGKGLQEEEVGPRLVQCAFVRTRGGKTIRFDASKGGVCRAEDLEVLDWEGFVRVAVPELDIQEVIALDGRLEWLEKIGREKPDSEIRFSRAAVNGQRVCECLNEMNTMGYVPGLVGVPTVED